MEAEGFTAEAASTVAEVFMAEAVSTEVEGSTVAADSAVGFTAEVGFKEEADSVADPVSAVVVAFARAFVAEASAAVFVAMAFVAAFAATASVVVGDGAAGVGAGV